MLTSLEFENFRGFSTFRAEMGAVTAMLGPNSSGKTTALHAIRFACDALRLAIDSDQTTRPSDNDVGTILVADGLLVDYTRLLPLADWRALFADQKVGEGENLRIRLEFDNADPIRELHVALTCARNEQLKLTVRVTAPEAGAEIVGLARKSKFVRERLVAFLKRHAPVAVFVPPFYGTVRQEEYRTRATLDRMLGAGDQSHVVRNLVVGLDAQQFERLNSFLGDTVGAAIVNRTPSTQVEAVSHLTVTFRDTNGEIELSSAGAGLVNLIALYTALSRWRLESANRPVIFLLDEPEAHLHPRLQADMSERLAILVNREYRGQLVMATHSVDILNRLATMGATLIRCDRRAEPSTQTLRDDAALFDDLATWVDLTPYTAINFLAARRVVFCEGDDELALLPALGKLLFRNNPRSMRAFERWSLVRLHGATNAPLADLLARLVRSDAVRARLPSASFHVHVILDRDHSRLPGTTVRPNDGVTEATTVWSRHSVESLLLTEPSLSMWIRAFLGRPIPDNLGTIVQDALDAADRDLDLNRAAAEHLAAALAMGDLRDADGRPLGGEQKFVHAFREANRLVDNEPAVWQRGKDRGRFVLGRIRDRLPHDARRQLPTDVIRLVTRTETDRISDPTRAVPPEVAELLNRLAAD